MSFESSGSSIDSYFLGLDFCVPPTIPQISSATPAIEECLEYLEYLEKYQEYAERVKLLRLERESEFESVFYKFLELNPKEPFSKPFFLHCKENTKDYMPSEAIVFGRECLEALKN
jgi:hypothetical protein